MNMTWPTPRSTQLQKSSSGRPAVLSFSAGAVPSTYARRKLSCGACLASGCCGTTDSGRGEGSVSRLKSSSGAPPDVAVGWLGLISARMTRCFGA